jgi:TPR repeat protein
MVYSKELVQKAERGFVDAQYNLGVCYAKGDGVPKDSQMAICWLEKSAEQGFANAQFLLGTYYDIHRCFDLLALIEDKGKAAYWYAKAAEQGHDVAQLALGDCYSSGQGCTKDQKMAVYWYAKAAEQGRAEAPILAAFCHEESLEYVEAYAWALCATKIENEDPFIKESVDELIEALTEELDDAQIKEGQIRAEGLLEKFGSNIAGESRGEKEEYKQDENTKVNQVAGQPQSNNDGFDAFLDWMDKNRIGGFPRNENDPLKIERLCIRSRNEITHIPPEISRLENLIELRIDGSSLMSVPFEIRELKRLKTLWLLGGRLTEFPLGICEITSLEELILGSHSIPEIPPEIGNLTNLKVLDLSNNPITEIPPELGQLEKLENLCLAEDNLIEFPRVTLKLKSLKWLNLTGNRIESVPLIDSRSLERVLLLDNPIRQNTIFGVVPLGAENKCEVILE